MHFLDPSGGDQRSVTLAVGSQTTMREILPLVLRKFNLNMTTAAYNLELDGNGEWRLPW